jgi:hypothetical protein
MIFGLLGLSLVHVTANVILARDEKSRRTNRILHAHRWALWMAALIPVVGLGLATYWLCVLQRNSWFGYYDENYGYVNWFMFPLLVCPALTFFLLRRLALRLSRPRLAEHITIVAVGAAASLLIMALSAVGSWSDLRHSDANFFFLLVVPWALVWFFNLWATLLLFVVADRFWESAKESRTRWRAADASRERGSWKLNAIRN